MLDTKSLQLAARFALPPNSLGYCGKGTAPEKFKSCIIDGKCSGVGEELDKFIVLGPYLKTLAKITGKNRFSYPVIEAYWLGNSELKKARPNDYLLLLNEFAKQGVPAWFVDDLKKRPPKAFIPFHLFQVLHVGVGRASGSVPYNLESINNCMIRWGKVEAVSKPRNKVASGLKSAAQAYSIPVQKQVLKRTVEKKYMTVNLNSLKKIKGGFKLIQKKEIVAYKPELVLGLKLDDFVAVHWKQVVKKLTSREGKNLEFWTKEVINTVTGN